MSLLVFLWQLNDQIGLFSSVACKRSEEICIILTMNPRQKVAFRVILLPLNRRELFKV